MYDSWSAFWGHSVHFAKFLMLIFSKSYYFQFFSYNFNQTLVEKACNREKHRPLLFLSICQILKVYGTLQRSYLNYIHYHYPKICWFHLATGQADRQGPFGLLFFTMIASLSYFTQLKGKCKKLRLRNLILSFK